MPSADDSACGVISGAASDRTDAPDSNWKLTESRIPAIGFKSASTRSYGNTDRTADVLSGTTVTAGTESDTHSNPCGLTACNNICGICMPVRCETGWLPDVHPNKHSGDDSNVSAVQKDPEIDLTSGKISAVIMMRLHLWAGN